MSKWKPSEHGGLSRRQFENQRVQQYGFKNYYEFQKQSAASAHMTPLVAEHMGVSLHEAKLASSGNIQAFTHYTEAKHELAGRGLTKAEKLEILRDDWRFVEWMMDMDIDEDDWENYV